MMHFGPGMGGGLPLVMMTVRNLAFWAVVVVAAVALTRYSRRARLGSTSLTGQATTPGQVLAQRFAKGDTDEQEYTDRLRVLSISAEAERTGS